MCKTNQVAAYFEKNVNMAGDVAKKVEMFCYFGVVLLTESGVQEALTSKIKAG